MRISYLRPSLSCKRVAELVLQPFGHANLLMENKVLVRESKQASELYAA